MNPQTESWNRWDNMPKGHKLYTSPTGAPVGHRDEHPPCPFTPKELRHHITIALKEPSYVRRKSASYLVVDGKLVHDGKGDFICVSAPRKSSKPKAQPVAIYTWAKSRVCEFPSRYTDGRRFTAPHRAHDADLAINTFGPLNRYAQAVNDNLPIRAERWTYARPVKLREALPIVTALRKEGDRLYRPDIDTPREALIFTAQTLADDFEIAALPAGYVPTNHCRHTDEHLEGFKLLQRQNERDEFEGAAIKARSETYSWLPVVPSEAFEEDRFSVVAGKFTVTEPVWVDTASKVEEETTRHASYDDAGKVVIQMRAWVITTSAVARVNADGISVWQRVSRTPTLDADGKPKHSGKPTNELRFKRKDIAPADSDRVHDLSGADARVQSVQHLELIRRVLTKNQFRMLRLACLEGATMTEIAGACGFGTDKRATAEVRGILREALTRTAEIYAKLAAIDRGVEWMSVRDWMDLGDINKVLSAGNDNVAQPKTDRGHLVAA